MGSKSLAAPLALAALTIGGLAGYNIAQERTPSLQANQPAGSVQAESPQAQRLLDIQGAFHEIAETAQHAVVSISARRSAEADGGGFGFGPQASPMLGSGSGFIVREDGWILTNDHVVSGADEVTVRLNDGREFRGTVRRDFASDLAAIKIEQTGLPTLKMADSSQVKVGSWAIAYGSPFGLDETLTVGVVSALGRETVIGAGTQAARFYPELLQTDASINPGNSGGPLLDINGSVIGVNVAINSPSGGSVGIGFAIPSNDAQYVLEQLVTKGAVTRGYLGLGPEKLTPTDATRYGVQRGALITSLQDSSPAGRAGLLVEDVVTAFNGTAVESDTQLRRLITRTPPGQEVSLTVVRGGKEQTLKAVVGTHPLARTAPAQNPQTSASPGDGKLGIQVTDMTPEFAQRLQVPATTRGAVVTGVQPGGAAMEVGIQPGDLIVRINGQAVGGGADIAKALVGAKRGDEMSLVVRRGDSNGLVRIRVR